MQGINKVHQANNLTERALYFLCLVRSKLKCACGRSPVVIGVLKMFKKHGNPSEYFLFNLILI